MNNILKIVIVFLIVISIIFVIVSNISVKEKYINHKSQLYEKLRNNYSNIFSKYGNNRNSCSFLYYHYIMNNLIKDNNIEDFILYSQLFCPVSGSLIDPNREMYEISLKKLNSDEMINGYINVCCSPCLCDMIKYSRVESYAFDFDFSDYNFDSFNVITIEDPCKYTNNVNKYINEITCVDCSNNKIKNGFLSNSGRLIIGILHNKEIVDKFNKDSRIIKQNDYKENCDRRNSMDVKDLNYGMGDIFIKLATIKNYV